MHPEGRVSNLFWYSLSASSMKGTNTLCLREGEVLLHAVQKIFSKRSDIPRLSGFMSLLLLQRI